MEKEKNPEPVFLVWDDRFSVKNDKLDKQHKKIVNIINDLYRAIQNGKSCETLARILIQLNSYTDLHLAFEETLMELKKYPEIETHKKAHKRFVEKAEEIRKKDNGENTNTMCWELLSFLKDWWAGHVIGFDRKYIPYLIDKD